MPRIPSPSLISLDGRPGIRLESPVVLVGRSSECDVMVDSKKVSRKHCVLALIGADCLVVKDLASTNGVRINGERKHEFKLYHGDELQIADLSFRFDVGVPSRNRPDATAFAPSDSMIERSDRPIALFEEASSNVG